MFGSLPSAAQRSMKPGSPASIPRTTSGLTFDVPEFEELT